MISGAVDGYDECSDETQNSLLCFKYVPNVGELEILPLLLII